MNKWDIRFLELAKHISNWSKDPSTSVGAVIVDSKNRIVSCGYNGFPVGIDDNVTRLNNRDEKLDLTIHAELNSILFANKKLGGCTLYVWPLPSCVRCAAHIIQTGIIRVVSPKNNNERWMESCNKAKQIMEEAGLKVDWVDFS